MQKNYSRKGEKNHVALLLNNRPFPFPEELPPLLLIFKN